MYANFQILEGSFSAVQPIFASEHSFYSICRALQDLRSFAPLQTQNANRRSVKMSAIWWVLAEDCKIITSVDKLMSNFEKISMFCAHTRCLGIFFKQRKFLPVSRRCCRSIASFTFANEIVKQHSSPSKGCLKFFPTLGRDGGAGRPARRSGRAGAAHAGCPSLSWKVRSARDRTIRTFQIGVRS